MIIPKHFSTVRLSNVGNSGLPFGVFETLSLFCI